MGKKKQKPVLINIINPDGTRVPVVLEPGKVHTIQQPFDFKHNDAVQVSGMVNVPIEYPEE